MIHSGLFQSFFLAGGGGGGGVGVICPCPCLADNTTKTLRGEGPGDEWHVQR